MSILNSVHKPFSKENYETNDFSAKKTVMSFLKKIALSVIENPDKYGIDLIADGVTHNGQILNKVFIEVERRNIWDYNFPFSSVHIPERKTKFFNQRILYAVVNSNYNRIMLCPSDIITQFTPVEISNKSIKEGEFFYDVPLKYWKIYNV